MVVAMTEKEKTDMKTNRTILKLCTRVCGMVLAVGLLAPFHVPLVSGQGPVGRLNANPAPFDFSDEFYLVNGIDFTKLPNRVGEPTRNPAHWAFDDSNTDPTRRGVRITQTTGGFDKDGNLIYYSVMADVPPAAFTDDPAGVRARAVAEKFRAFLFPKTERNPDGSIKKVVLSPALPNRRQDNIFETVDAYFCDNLLGLWLVTFVIYTQKAFTAEGQAVLDQIAARNGRDLDGTPILKRLDEILRLRDQGLAELRSNPETGGEGPRWVS